MSYLVAPAPEIAVDHAAFAAIWGDRKLFQVHVKAAGLRLGDDVRLVERILADGAKTGRFVLGRVSYIDPVDGLPDKVILGLIKVYQGDERIQRGF